MPGSEQKLSGLNTGVDHKRTLTAGFRAGTVGVSVGSKLEVYGGVERARRNAGERQFENIPVENEGRASDFCEYRYSLRKAAAHIKCARLVVPAEQGASVR